MHDIIDESLRHVSDYVAERRTLMREEFLDRNRHPVLLVTVDIEGRDAGPLRTADDMRSPAFRNMMNQSLLDMIVVPVFKRSSDVFRQKIWIGREKACDVPLPFEGVSKLQGEFVQKGSDWQIIDSGSTNGTFVDGERLEKGKAVTLQDGSRIIFGTLETYFHTPEGFYEQLTRAVS